MNRLKALLAAIILPVCAILTVAPIAQAQSINCTKNVLDATAAQGIATDQITRQISMLREVYPNADVRVHAYEQLPGGSLEGFINEARQQCVNWTELGGERLKDNLMVVVYGRNIDQVGVFYGYHFDSVVSSREYGYMMNAVNSSLGPNKSQADPNYVTSAIQDALRSTESLVALFNRDTAKRYGTQPSPYDPAPFQNPNDNSAEFDAVVFGLVILGVIGGFAVFGAICWLASSAFRRASGRP